MKAVIMAGGKGTRLRPLTCSLPKPMVPLLNKPCMSYIIELLKAHGLTDIAVTTQYIPEAITRYYGDGRDYGVNLRYYDETVPLGTAGSIKNAEDFLDERFVVISGDALTDIDLTEAVRFHERSGSSATLVLARVERPLEFGVVQTDPNGKIIRFLEKPDWPEVFSDTVNTGIYIVEPDVLAQIPAGREYDFSKELFPSLMEAGIPLYGYVTDRYWSDIGSIDQYKQTQFDMLDGKVEVQLDGRSLMPGVWAHEDAQLDESVRILGPAYIGSGARVEPGTVLGPYSIIGHSARVGGASELERSIIWDNAQLGQAVEMRGSLLCNHSAIGDGSRLKAQSVIGSHCRIGRRATVAGNVHVWPEKEVRDDAHVPTSLIWGGAAASRLFGDWGAQGEAGVEMTPQSASRFAQAYASQLPEGSRLLVTNSEHPYAAIMKESIIPALQTACIDVIDGGTTLPDAARAYILEAGMDGYIHVQHAAGESEIRIRLECGDAAGLPIASAVARKVESAYNHNDFRRVQPDRLGGRGETYVNDVYARRFAEAAGWAGEELGTVAVCCDPGIFGLTAALLGPGASRIVYAGSPNEHAFWPLMAGADLKLILDESGRTLRVLDARGEAIEGDDLLCLAVAAVSHCSRGRTFGLPVDAPAVAESIAEGLGGHARRTKNDPRSMLQATDDPLFHPVLNGLYAAAMLMRHMARSGQRPEEILAAIPPQYRSREWIDCPWERKGSIFRLLTERHESEATEWPGGLRFDHDDGSVLVLHATDAPLLQLVVETDSHEKLDWMTQKYREEIAQYLI
ncbi:sugar phosphate nucleotidyltransferase [Paenibacillus methanolicus]|uniref:Mannose-1-phosphate guanylyltransferase/phosphomannomutase n=1 Tax=Paenibacillus methanolicus TaxID=582686 RepID=A0A5S5BT94_9BACL|nr:sugar phosphate nucleotidyltransferase [Paenibacillus methanolicus]TYP70259.1 mannose-1-phosphate guanylyltransferase/phosphomannomutase [Paenibacillus methanolicus]